MIQFVFSGHHTIEKNITREFVNLILMWYGVNKRNFLWRVTKDPYKILISEFLLQKTDAQKVENLYQKFIGKYPSIYHLYQSKPDEINKLIKSIGLHYRSQRLKKTAEQIVENFNGSVPDKKEELLSLPGVGEYISNAILCFAFNEKVPIVDTNVLRVYERFFNIKSFKSRARTDKEIWKFAESILPEKGYIEYNYALLDFASIVCKAKKPICDNCTLNNICAFYKNK